MSKGLKDLYILCCHLERDERSPVIQNPLQFCHPELVSGSKKPTIKVYSFKFKVSLFWSFNKIFKANSIITNSSNLIPTFLDPETSSG